MHRAALTVAVAALLPATSAAVSSATITVNVTGVVATVDAEYISANFDWHTAEEEYPAWVNSSIMNINLTDPRLLTLGAEGSVLLERRGVSLTCPTPSAASAFAPAHLRVGGSEQDGVPSMSRGASAALQLVRRCHALQMFGTPSTAPARRPSMPRSASRWTAGMRSTRLRLRRA